jgi:2-succinyl-5-enolpyruvyl-6-hydroxy-3-cyclohexene-1-carboxylate synthase
VLQELAAHGVAQVVLAPGSRSAPLAHALAVAAQAEPPEGAPRLDLHVRIDERSAGFLALGLAKAAAAAGHLTGVAVVTTSGTAVANLHPAVLEAHHAGLPLVLLTADRPHELRGTGANQTTDQVGIFGTATRFAVDVPAPSGRPGEDRDLRALVSRAVAAALGTRTAAPGPVHLNLSFRDPLAPDGAAWPSGSTAGRAVVVGGVTPTRGWVRTVGATGDDASPPDLPTVIVAGDGAGAAAGELAEARGWPLLAEPSSGARSGTRAIPAYRLLLDSALGRRVRCVVVLGRPTLSRPVQSLLARADVRVVVIAAGAAPWVDPSRRADVVLPAVPAAWLLPSFGGDAGTGPAKWLMAWQRAGAAAAAAIDLVLDEPQTIANLVDRTRATRRVTGPLLARVVARASGPDDVLVVGSSNPIRDLDLVAAWAQAPTVLSNRGLAGIDGTVSTAIGVALATHGRRVRALMGDLTFLHDIGGLLRGPLEREPDLQIVVANDDGGSIFATLEHGAPSHAEVFERVFGTPHGADLAALCAGYGVRYQLARDAEELEVALAVPGPGLSVVEVRLDRSGRRALGLRLAAVAGSAAAAVTESAPRTR